MSVKHFHFDCIGTTLELEPETNIQIVWVFRRRLAWYSRIPKKYLDSRGYAEGVPAYYREIDYARILSCYEWISVDTVEIFKN